MKAEPFVVTPDAYAPALDVLDTKITVLASKAATQSYEITLQRGDEGTGPPPHSHAWDEAFYVTKGSVEFIYGGKTATCLPGTLVHVPAGTVHGFRYGAGGGEMLEITGQGGRATQTFTAVSEEVGPGASEAEVREVLGRNGVVVAG